MLLLILGCSAHWRATDVVDTGAAAGDDTTAESGESGDTADSTDTGESGESGETGDSAETGDSGDSAETGDSGETGETGDSGETGETGDTSAAIPPPCTAYTTPVLMGTVGDKSLDEISGLAVSTLNPDILWVQEDHAGAASLYALDLAGNTVMELALDGATNNDWEDLALAPCGPTDPASCLWVGEIGNNSFDRVGLGVYRVVEPYLADLGSSPTAVTWDFYEFTYPDAAENAEALYVGLDGLPVLLSKRYNAGTSGVYQWPALDPAKPVTLTWLGDFSTSVKGDKGAGAEVTGADLWPDGSRVIVRTYGHVYELDGSGGAAGLAASARTEVTGSGMPRGETVAYDAARGGFWEISEGINPGMWFTGCAK